MEFLEYTLSYCLDFLPGSIPGSGKDARFMKICSCRLARPTYQPKIKKIEITLAILADLADIWYPHPFRMPAFDCSIWT